MGKPTVRILWAEDNVGDILLIKEAFSQALNPNGSGQAKLNYHLNVVNDGIEAMNFLLRRGRFSRSRRPDLVILDLNMPKKTGREIIDDIKNTPSLCNIPLVILTSSAHDQNVLNGLDPKRCLYIVKPTSFEALVDLAKQIQNFLLLLSGPQQDS